jgi:hypothetical protein
MLGLMHADVGSEHYSLTQSNEHGFVLVNLKHGKFQEHG